MICYWCRGTPARLKDMNQYRLITITDRELGARDCHKEDQDWICPTCLAALRRCRAERMEVGRREQLDESQDKEPEDLSAAHERGAVVLQREDQTEEAGFDEIWDEIRFR